MLATQLGPMPSGGRRGFQDPAAAAHEGSVAPNPTREGSQAAPGTAPAEKGGGAAAAGDPTVAGGAAGGAARGNAEAGAADGEAADDGKAKKSKSRAAKVRSLAAGTPHLCVKFTLCCERHMLPCEMGKCRPCSWAACGIRGLKIYTKYMSKELSMYVTNHVAMRVHASFRVMFGHAPAASMMHSKTPYALCCSLRSSQLQDSLQLENVHDKLQPHSQLCNPSSLGSRLVTCHVPTD